AAGEISDDRNQPVLFLKFAQEIIILLGSEKTSRITAGIFRRQEFLQCGKPTVPATAVSIARPSRGNIQARLLKRVVDMFQGLSIRLRQREFKILLDGLANCGEVLCKNLL